MKPSVALLLCCALGVSSAFLANTAAAETKRLKTPICLGTEICQKGPAAYEAWELPLKTPAQLARCTIYSSTPFYAVILKRNVAESAELDCDDLAKSPAIQGAVAERARAQAAFKGNKAFLRLLCTGGGPFVQYAIRGERGMLRSFLVLYAGNDHTKALGLTAAAKASYPEAAMVEMSASIERGDQDCR